MLMLAALLALQTAPPATAETATAIEAAAGNTAGSEPAASRAFDAWRAGDLAAAGALAQDAMAALETRGCSVSPDGARLAYMLAMASHFELVAGESGYWFWAAGRLDAAAGGLDRTERRVARTLAGQPGRGAALDHLFATSPYFDRGLEPSSCASDTGVLADPRPGSGAAAYLSVEVRTRNDLSVRGLRLVAAYPHAEGAPLSDAIRSVHLATGSHSYAPRRFVFDPCESFFDRPGDVREVCRSDRPR